MSKQATVIFFYHHTAELLDEMWKGQACRISIQQREKCSIEAKTIRILLEKYETMQFLFI